MLHRSSTPVSGIYFNPRSREGSDVLHKTGISPICNFNPRSREGSDARRLPFVRLHEQFQSTLPRGERRCRKSGTRQAMGISIHAPARGATVKCLLIIRLAVYFNPRSREGSDPIRPSVSGKQCWISIHAPARGATCRIRRFRRLIQ